MDSRNCFLRTENEFKKILQWHAVKQPSSSAYRENYYPEYLAQFWVPVYAFRNSALNQVATTSFQILSNSQRINLHVIGRYCWV
jgi:hypothetical protein